MDENPPPTVEMSLVALEDVIAKSTADLLASRNAIARARADIASANTSLSRTIITDAEHAINHLRKAEQALTLVLSKLLERD